MPHCSNTTLEQTIREEFRDRWTGWLETYQPGLGGGTGVPDTQIMARPPLITPIELKRGTIQDGTLWVDTIRPAQVSWHTRFTEAGGKSYFIIGAMVIGELRMYVVRSFLVIDARKYGLPLRSIYQLPFGHASRNDKVFSQALKDFLT